MKSIEKNSIPILIPELKQIDVNNSPRFREELDAQLANRDKVILDLGNVHFMDSTGLGIIVSALRTMNEKKGALAICSITPAVKVLFDMVRMSQIASLYASREEALTALSS
ncbi:MAG: STAS domain-containing protein [Spirochaetales bacterium]|nr:STAS domain-containing protein [Spirochaetales bacterium]